MMKLRRQFKTKIVGILLIIVGCFIPSILYPFSSITPKATLVKTLFAIKGVSYDTSLQDREIVFKKGQWKKDGSMIGGGHFEGRLALPFKYTMAFGVLLSFIGIGFVAFSKYAKSELANGEGEKEAIRKAMGTKSCQQSTLNEDEKANLCH